MGQGGGGDGTAGQGRATEVKDRNEKWRASCSRDAFPEAPSQAQGKGINPILTLRAHMSFRLSGLSMQEYYNAFLKMTYN